jgi:RNA recognition motif-containing protein
MTIYIGNLSYQATTEDLKVIFENYGTVRRVVLPTDRETGKMRGFAFIEMSDDTIEDVVIERLDGTDLLGREIKVSKARPKEVKREVPIPGWAREQFDRIDRENALYQAITTSQGQHGNRLILRIEVSDNSPSDAVALELSNLCKAINAYHIACSGTGLTIDDWEILVPARQLVGV